MDPLVILAAQHKRVLLPHETLAHPQPHVETRATEVVALRVRVEDVESRSGLHRLFCAPEGVAQELAELRVLHRVVLDRETVRPLVGHVVGRVGEPAVDRSVARDLRHVLAPRRIAAEEEVLSEDVHLARLRHRDLRGFGRIVGIGLAHLVRRAAEEFVEFGRVEPERTHVEAGLLQGLHLCLQQIHVPLGDLAGLVVGDAQGLFLLRGEVVDHDGGNRLRADFLHGLHAGVAVDDHEVAVYDDRADEPVLADGRDHAGDRLVVHAGVVRIGLQVRYLQVLNRWHLPSPCAARLAAQPPVFRPVRGFTR